MENYSRIKRMMEVYILFVVYKVYFKGITFNVLVNRSKSLVKFDGIQIFRGKMYSPAGLLDKKEFQDFTYKSIEALFKEDMDEKMKYSESAWTKLDQTMFVRKRMGLTKQIDRNERKLWLKMYDIFGKKEIYSYMPTEEEELLMSRPKSKAKEEAEYESIRAKYLELVDVVLSRVRDVDAEEDTQTYEENLSVMSSLTLKESLTWPDVVNYFKTRHDIFANLFQSANGLSESSTDVKMSKYFANELKGDMDHMLDKTPDMIVRTGPVTYRIIEFAVTDSSVSYRIQDKLDKYSPAVNHINSKSSLKVDLEVYVLDMANMEVSSWPAGITYNKPDCTYLSTVHDKVKLKKNFEKFRTMMEMGLNETKMDKLDKLHLDLIKLLENKSLRKTKAARLTDSREVNSDFKVVKNDEDLYLDELKSRTTSLTTETMALKFISNYTSSASYTECFSPEVVKMTKDMTAEGTERMVNLVKTEIEKAREIRRTTKDNIPSMFKFPWMDKKMKASLTPRTGFDKEFLEDGTILFKAEAEIESKKMEVWEEGKNMEGIGFTEEDVEMVDSLLELLRTGEDEEEIDYFDKMKTSIMWECLEMWEELTREIALMSERRFVSTNEPKFFAMKRFKHFWLEMHKGPKITKEKQARFRIHIDPESGTLMQKASNIFFKSFKNKMKFSLATDWLAVSMMDLEHFQTISSRVRLMMRHFSENIKADSMMFSVMSSTKKTPRFYLVPTLIMMEHKRNTSTSAQTARYVMHNVTSLLSDTAGIIKEILSVPIRTRVQAFVVQSQLNWMSEMLKKDRMSLKHFGRILTEKRDFDKVHMPSMYDPSVQVEFSVIMDEIYYSNVFNQKMGFRSHREKAIWEKQAKEERNFRSISVEEMKPRPFSDFLKMEDKHHIYSSETVRLAVKNWLAKERNKNAMNRAILEAEAETIEEIVKMTKSVTSGPSTFVPFLSYSREVEKKSVLEAVIAEMERMESTLLAEYCAADEAVYAIFSTFAKDQFGGAREILVQAIKTRIHTAYLNRFFKKMCEYHPKEMITNEKKKAELQCSSCVTMKDLFIASVKSNSDSINMPLVINADASKWAPSMVMEYFIEMLDEMKMEGEMVNHMTTIFRAYSAKALFLPNSLREKWLKKPSEIKEISEDLQWVRDEVDLSTGMMIFFSGMGQGNFQHPSSFFHCLIDDLMDDVLERVLKSLKIDILMNVTLISSDDSTKMMSIKIPVKDWDKIFAKVLLIVADIFTTVRKAANIHINWKKTALQSMIVEFNSMFSIGKRVALAVIKSLYNSQNIVDMTFPEKAVKEVISHCRPLLEEGATIPTVETAMSEMRKKLIKWYNLEPRMTKLTGLLNCKEEDLPAPLGFVPINNIVETMVYGAEYHYIGTGLSEELTKFYTGLYTADASVMSERELKLDADEVVTTKYMIKLKTMLDKKVEEMKRKIVTNREVLESEMEKWALSEDRNTALMQELDFYLRERVMNMSLIYEFSESFRFNSMIRAMQLVSKPFATNFGEDGPTFDDLEHFVREMIKNSTKRSSVRLLSKLAETKAEIEATKSSLTRMAKVPRSSHEKFRSLAFFDVSNEAFATEREILQCIMSGRYETKLRVFRAAQEVADSLGLVLADLFSNAFGEIKKAFPNSKTPFLDFRNYLRLYAKTFFRNTMRVVCDFKPDVKKANNILNLYRTKSYAGYILVGTSMENTTLYSDLMDNLMLTKKLSDVREIMSKITKNDVGSISQKDSRKEWAIKLISKANKNNTVKAWEAAKNRELFFYTETGTRRMFVDPFAVIVLEIQHSTDNTYVKIRVRKQKGREKDYEITSQMKALVEREIMTEVRRMDKLKIMVEINLPMEVASMRAAWARITSAQTIPVWNMDLKLYKVAKTDSWSIRAKIQGEKGLDDFNSIVLVTEEYYFHQDAAESLRELGYEDEISEAVDNMMNSSMSLAEVIKFSEKMSFFKTDLDFRTKPGQVASEIMRRVDVAESSVGMIKAISGMTDFLSSIGQTLKDETREEFESFYDTPFLETPDLSSFYQNLATALAATSFTKEPEVEVGDITENVLISNLVMNSLWNAFDNEFFFSAVALKSYTPELPALNVRLAFSNYKDNLRKYLKFEPPDDIVLTLLMMVARRGALVFKDFPFEKAMDISDSRAYEYHKNVFPKPKDFKVPVDIALEMDRLDRL